jgi:hypothetical protein
MNTHTHTHVFLHKAPAPISCLLVPAAYTAAVNGQLQEQVGQPPQHGHADSQDSMVRALPTHISDFGESPPDDRQALLTEAALGAKFQAGGAAGVLEFSPEHSAGAGAVLGEDSAPHLPSHISAFGDDLGPLPGVRAVLSASGELEDGFAAGGSCVGHAPLGLFALACSQCAPRSFCSVQLFTAVAAGCSDPAAVMCTC